jgi:hypothetical protein
MLNPALPITSGCEKEREKKWEKEPKPLRIPKENRKGGGQDSLAQRKIRGPPKFP